MRHAALEVLLIDPHAAIGHDFDREMRAYNAHVLRSNNLRDVTHALRTHSLAAVFISLDHFHTQAIKIIKRVHSNPHHRHVPITVFAAKTDLVPLENACRAGATHFVVEPFLRTHLQRLLQSMQHIFPRERRRTCRLPMRVPVVLTQGAYTLISRTHELSTRSMVVTSTHPMDPRQSLRVRFPSAPKNLQPLELSGHFLRRITPDTIAIAFAEASAELTERLAQWINEASQYAHQRS